MSKQQMQEMKVDDVDKVLDEINDQNDQLQQINTAMQTPIGDAANMDDDELARELEVGLVSAVSQGHCIRTGQWT